MARLEEPDETRLLSLPSYGCARNTASAASATYCCNTAFGGGHKHNPSPSPTHRLAPADAQASDACVHILELIFPRHGEVVHAGCTHTHIDTRTLRVCSFSPGMVRWCTQGAHTHTLTHAHSEYVV
jgi:hypothetical protein